jgi:Aminoglycoside/hydroxyurea antibiotic resistance kinase
VAPLKAMSERVEERVRDWGVVVQDTLETQTPFIAFGKRGDQSVVLKVIRQPGDEWRCGEVSAAFGENGMARVYEYTEGAALLERLNPGAQLASIALDGRDEEATEILADVIDRMSRPCESLDESSREASKAFGAARDWGEGFQRDELELFFTRAGKNGPAIYRSTRKSVSHPFDPPVRVDAIKGFVEAPALSPDGRSLYYHLREGARFVIYRAARSL